MAPKSQNFPAGVPYVNQMLTLDVVQKGYTHTQDIRDLNSSDDSISKNSTNISQALKVKGLLSTGTKEQKSSNNNTNIQTSGRTLPKQEERKSIKNAFTSTKTGNTMYSEHERKQSVSKERNGMNEMLQVRGIPKKNNLLSSYDIEKATLANASDDEEHPRIFDSPSKDEDISLNQLNSPKLNSAQQRNTSQNRNFAADQKTRNSSSKYKKSSIISNDQEEEEKRDKNKAFRNRENSVNKVAALHKPHNLICFID